MRQWCHAKPGMSWRLVVMVVLANTVLPLGAVFANDSIAGLANGGGLVLQRTQDIEMRTETLTISAERIAVQYQFHNRSAKPITTTVAFPLPDIETPTTEAMIRAMPSDDAENPFDFSAIVDGHPVELQNEQKAVGTDGVDHADLLRRLDVPLRPDTQPVYEALQKLPRERWDELVKLGMAVVGSSGPGPGAYPILEPRWVWKTTFYWQQTFPPGVDSVVEHRYRPSVGHALGLYLLESASRAEYRKRYCPPATVVEAIKRAVERGVQFEEKRIDYVLKTGANWAGPIGKFRLILDQGKPGNWMLTCVGGLQQTTPTQFVSERRNFTPMADLSILILEQRPE